MTDLMERVDAIGGARRVQHHVRFHDGDQIVEWWWDQNGRELTAVEVDAILSAEAHEAPILWPLMAAEPDPRLHISAPVAWIDNGWPQRFAPERCPAVWLQTELGTRATSEMRRQNGGWTKEAA